MAEREKGTHTDSQPSMQRPKSNRHTHTCPHKRLVPVDRLPALAEQEVESFRAMHSEARRVNEFLGEPSRKGLLEHDRWGTHKLKKATITTAYKYIYTDVTHIAIRT